MDTSQEYEVEAEDIQDLEKKLFIDSETSSAPQSPSFFNQGTPSNNAESMMSKTNSRNDKRRLSRQLRVHVIDYDDG